MAGLTTVQKPVDVFCSIKMESGVAPEFPLDILHPADPNRGQAFYIPARGRDPEKAEVTSVDTVWVPHFDIHHQEDEGQKAIDAFNAEVNGHAWKLLKMAADLNEKMGTGTVQELRDKMRLHFAKLHKVDEKNVEVKVCRQGNELIGVYQNDTSVIMTHHSDGPQFWHTPHTKPICWIDAGFAVLDHRNVVEGTVCS